MQANFPQRGPLGPFAAAIEPLTWIGGQATISQSAEHVWQGVGPESVPIVARRDGLVVFEFDKSAAYQGGGVPGGVVNPGEKVPAEISKAEDERKKIAYRRFTYMNAFLHGLYSAYSSVEKQARPVQAPVTPTTYVLMARLGSDFAPHQSTLRHIEQRPSRTITQVPTIEHAVEIMSRCNNKFADVYADLLSLIYLACHQYSLHQFASAHVLAWTVIEKQLNVRWTDYVSAADAAKGGHTAMNRDRRDQLTGRDFTASIVTQTLSLANKLDDKLRLQLDAARKARNYFAHGLAPIEPDDAAKAIRTATDFLTDMLDFRVTSQLSLSYNI